MGDRQNLNNEDLDLLFDVPLSSELDPIEVPMSSEPDRAMSDNDSGSYIGSDTNDTEDDPGFAFSDECMDNSDEEDIYGAVANEDVFVNGSENGESVNNISVNDEAVNSVNRSLNDEHAHNGEDLMEIAESEEVGLYVSLNEKYKNLNKRVKARM